MVKALVTRQKIPDSNPDSDVDICSGSDFTLYGGPGLFIPYVLNMTVPSATNQLLMKMYKEKNY